MKKADIKAHYAADIKGATNAQLFAIIRGEIKGSKAVKDALYEMADVEMRERGVTLPGFSAWFAL